MRFANSRALVRSMTLSHLADRFTVILDANVLYPFRVRDVLLRFYEEGLFRARWTDQIIDEWTRNLIRNRPDHQASVLAQVEQMKAHFNEAWVMGYEPLIQSLQLPDPDDRHVLAAAIVCGAQHIVTENLKDFPAEVLDEFDIEPIELGRIPLPHPPTLSGERCIDIQAVAIRLCEPALWSGRVHYELDCQRAA